MFKKICLFLTIFSLFLISFLSANPKNAKAELDPEVYAWETDGGAALFTKERVEKINGEVSFVAEMGFFEDAVLPDGVEIGFGISDSICEVSNYPYISNNAIFFSHLASSSYRVWNASEVISTFSSKKTVDGIYKQGNKIKVEITYKDGDGTSYSLSLLNGDEYQVLDTFKVPVTSVNLSNIEDYHLFFCINNNCIIKFFDINIFGNGNRCSFSMLPGNSLSFELVDAGASKYNVSFISNDTNLGTIQIDKNRMLKSQQLPMPLEVSGKVFSHWAYENGDRFNVSDKIVGDTTLYGIYRENTLKCGISNVWRCAYDGQWGLQIKFDTYIPNGDGIDLNDLKNLNEKMYITTDDKMPVWHQMRYESGYEIYDTFDDLSKGVTSNANSFVQWIDVNDFSSGSDSLILSLKEGASVGRWGETLDRDYNILIVKDKDNQSNVFAYILNEIVDVKTVEHYIEIDFSYYVFEDIDINLMSLIKINGVSLYELGANLIYADGRLSKRVLINLDSIDDLKPANTLTIESKPKDSDEYLKVNQYAVKSAIHTTGCSESILSIKNDLYSTYFGFNGNDYILSTKGSDTLCISATLNQELRVGDEIDLSKLSVKEYKFNGASIPQILEGATISGYDKTKVGEQDIVVTLSNSKVANLKVNVLPKLIGLEINALKTEFKYGSNLNQNDFKVYEIYEGNLRGREIKDFTISGYDKTKAQEQIVTITYQGIESTVNIKVVDLIKSFEAKLNDTLYVGCDLNLDSFTIDIIYESGKKETIKNVDSIYGFKKGTIGAQNVIVLFGEYSISLDIEVLDKIVGIVLVSIDSNVSLKNNIDLESIDIRYLYASGNLSDRIEITNENIKNFNSKKAGLQLIEIQVDEFKLNCGVFVEKNKGCKSAISSSIMIIVMSAISLSILYIKRRRNVERSM